ncbi:MAG: hypothetical protein QM805_07800 [Pseudomonas sp.]
MMAYAKMCGSNCTITTSHSFRHVWVHGRGYNRMVAVYHYITQVHDAGTTALPKYEDIWAECGEVTPPLVSRRVRLPGHGNQVSVLHMQLQKEIMDELMVHLMMGV